jgi:2-haloalkanoic acid dehalogenase type II
LPISGHELFRQWKTFDSAFRQTRLNLIDPDKTPPFKTYQQAWEESFIKVFAKNAINGDASKAAETAVENLKTREAFYDTKSSILRIQKQWETGLISNADNAYLLPNLNHIGLNFKAIVSSETARSYKPHSKPFLLTLSLLGISASQSIYVGDNPYDDVVGAKGVGMKVILINRYNRPKHPYPRPDGEIETLFELSKFLERWS